MKAGDQAVNLNLDLPGEVGMDTIKCKSCGGPLSSEDVKMVAGAPLLPALTAAQPTNLQKNLNGDL